jgi:glycosyltransferase involved in cell wall biosynthesis
MFFIYQLGGGGASRTILNIVNNLDQSKFIPVLVTLNFNGSYEKDLNSNVNFIKLPTKTLYKAIFQLPKIIRKEKPNIVFSTLPKVNVASIIANKLSFSKAKNIIREADNLGGKFTENVKLRLFGFFYRRADQIVSLSEGVKENLIQRYKIKADEIEVVYNPVDIEKIREKISNGEIQSEHKGVFATDEKIIITAGRLVEQKDHRTLLNAFAKIQQKVKSRLVILGEGPLKNTLLEQAKKLNISNKVFFLGFQENPYIYFNQSDLFVLSSIHEGFSHVIAEALATGTPVVSTDCKSGPSEVLDNGKYGLLCEVGNSSEMAEKIMKRLSMSEEKRKEIVDLGFQRAKFFDAKQIVKNYERIFLQTINEVERGHS